MVCRRPSASRSSTSSRRARPARRRVWDRSTHPRVAVLDRAVEDAERSPQRALGDDGKDVGLAPLWVNVGPVVERRDDGAVIGGFELVAVYVPDLRAELPKDRPGD